MSSRYFLYENKPAEHFWDAHYLGNGRLGLSVMGGIPKEEVIINEDTLWSGSERFVERPAFYDKLMEARRLSLEGKVKEANNIINEDCAGTWQETYLPMASLHIMTGMGENTRNMPCKNIIEQDFSEAEDYRRELDLDTACETVSWRVNGTAYSRFSFVSHPADCAFIRLKACRAGEEKPLSFALDLTSKLHAAATVQDGTYLLEGIAPDHCEPSYTPVTPEAFYGPEEQSKALRFACGVKVIDTDGKVHTDGQRLYVKNASYAWLAIQGRTNYAGFRKERDNRREVLRERLLSELEEVLKQAKAQGMDALFAAHLADYQALYRRVDIDLGTPLTDTLPTSQRMEYCTRGAFDPALSALYLQYVRYLTIAGSRPGTQAANLQGIWNDLVSPPWSSNYTTNINVEMNYWPAEVLNLSECHMPLMDLIRETAKAGEKTAEHYYRLGGWTAHHNVDLWRGTEPACEDASWAWWPFGGAWMCQHIWTHYQYTGDEGFLREMYPVLKGQAEFMLGFLCENEDGYLVTAPSVSPENKFLIGSEEKVAALASEIASGSRCSPNDPAISAVTIACTMDMSILRELFGNVRAANELLHLGDDAFAEKLAQAMHRFPPYKIGRFGQLQEWYEDYEECTPGMSHISHMYPVYPGELITEKTPELFAAAIKSIERRQLHSAEQGGWPAVWRICLEARFHNALECGHLIKSTGTGLGCGMLTKENQQIDAIFGLGAGLAEMLLQSHQGYLELLPAIPVDWRSGHVHGLCARGGYRVDIDWADGQMTDAAILAERDGVCTVKARGLQAVNDNPAIAEGDMVSFPVRAGERYTLRFKPEGAREIFL